MDVVSQANCAMSLARHEYEKQLSLKQKARHHSVCGLCCFRLFILIIVPVFLTLPTRHDAELSAEYFYNSI
jgi:hypothetical protein